MNLSRTINGKSECLLCPHHCVLAPGKKGICGVRINNGGIIELSTYGNISGYALDPVEKKPFYHFYPGHNILSIGSWGCNMRCDFCQNYHISQNLPQQVKNGTPPEFIAEEIREYNNNIGIAFTYNEPVIWFEYIVEIAAMAKKDGFKTAMVSNGFVSEEPLKVYLKLIDAFNIDLKAFTDDFYRQITGASLEPVKRTLKMIALAGKHLEITTLLIPGLNDTQKEMEELPSWIAKELGRSVPFHISRYFPMYKRNNPPTSEEKLLQFYEIASAHLDFVYLGNTHDGTGQDTRCPQCRSIVTKRKGYGIKHTASIDGHCSVCGKLIYPDFTFSSSSKRH